MSTRHPAPSNWPGLSPTPAAALPVPQGLAGQTLGAYRLLHEVGSGGMGTVWLAQRNDGRYEGQVAIKFMQTRVLRPGDSERFIREGQLLARLDHPHIARLLDAGVGFAQDQQPGTPYLVLEYVPGLPIDEYCQQQRLGTTALVRLMLRVLAAVAHAHSRLILHRDLKPSNILVGADGQPKLLDFGIGKLLAETGTPATTPTEYTDELTEQSGLAFSAYYAAPEQLQAQEVTTATDVYTLGVLLYGLLGGGHPTAPADASPVEQMRAVVEHPPRRLSDAVLRQGGPHARTLARALRGDLDTIVARALKKHPAERYAHAAALADDLRRWLDHEPVAARPDRAGYRFGRFMRRHLSAVVAAGSVGALSLAVGTGLALWQVRQAQADRMKAEALVQFMLGDLKDKLSQLGRVDILQAVGSKALAYYDTQNPKALDDGDLAQRAQALRVVAETARLRLDNVQAQRGFEQAAAATAHLLQREPSSVSRLQEHAYSLMKLDEMAVERYDSETALDLTRQISSLLHRAADLVPDQPALRLQALASDHGVAYALTRAGQPQPALQLLQRARSAARALPADLPRRLHEEADNHLVTGLAQYARGRHAAAAQAFEACIALMDQIPELHSDVWLRRTQGMVRRSLARALLHQGELDAALRLAQQMVQARSADARLHDHDRTLAQETTRDRMMLADILWLSGSRGAAQHQLSLIVADAAATGTVHEGHLHWHLGFVGDLLALRVRMGRGPVPDGALRNDLQALLQRAAQLEAKGTALQGQPLLAVLNAGLALGDAHLQAGERQVAVQHWQTVVRRATPAAETGFAPARQQLAWALLRLGQIESAVRWADQLQTTDYRHPDLATLQRQLAAAGASPSKALPTAVAADNLAMVRP